MLEWRLGRFKQRPMEDQSLLNQFARSGSEDAFRALVSRHLGLVLTVAERRTGNRSQAEDIAQNVFSALAGKAQRLRSHATIVGWLHRATINECALVHRRQNAHSRKMNAFSEHLVNDAEGSNVWSDALPELDAAINGLADADRELILLRFFERKSFREIGDSLAKSESAAQKQGERALNRLGDILRNKGVAITGVALTSGLSSQAIPVVSERLVTAISSGALKTVSTLTTPSILTELFRAMNPMQNTAVLVVGAIAAVPLAIQWKSNQDLKAQLEALANRPPAPVVQTAAPPKASVAVAKPRIPRQSETPTAAATVTPLGMPDQIDTWESALYEQDPVRRAQRIGQLLAALTAADATNVAAAFANARKSGKRFSEEYRLFLRAWGRLDGKAAMDFLVAANGLKKASSDMMAALAGWSSSNPYAATEWIDGLPKEFNPENLIYGLLDGWSMVDFYAAAAYAETRPRSPSRNRFRKLLLQRSLDAGGIPAAQQWFSNISNNDHNSLYKQYAFDEVIQAMLYRDPSAAALWISQMGEQKYITSKPVIQTAGALAKTAPLQAMQWLENVSLEKPVDSLHGKSRVLNQWAASDPAGAGAWLSQQLAGAGYDRMAGEFARLIAGTDATSAGEWARSIGDTRVRENAEKRVASVVARSQDGEMALDAVGLSGGVTELVLSDLGERPASNQSFAFTRAAGASGGSTGIAYLGTGDANYISLRTDNSGASGLIKAPQGENPHGNAYASTDCASCHAQSRTAARNLEYSALQEKLAVENAGNVILLKTDDLGQAPVPAESLNTRVRFETAAP